MFSIVFSALSCILHKNKLKHEYIAIELVYSRKIEEIHFAVSTERQRAGLVYECNRVGIIFLQSHCTLLDTKIFFNWNQFTL